MRLTRRRLYLFLFFALPFVYFMSVPISTSDLAIWALLGRYALEHGSLLRHDIFSFLPTTALVYPAGICLIYAAFYAIGGLLLVSFLHKLALLVLLALLYFSSLSRLASPWSRRNIVLVLLTWWGAASLVADRPAMIAMIPFLASFLILQKEHELSEADLAVLALINVFWVNIHGSWLLLTGMLAWRVIARYFFRPGCSRKEAVGAALILASSLLNPFGYRVFGYVLETARISKERDLAEWMTTDFRIYFPQGILFYSLVLALLYLCWRAWRSPLGREQVRRFLVSPYLPLFMLGASSIRNTVWPFLALLPMARQFGFLREDAPLPGARGQVFENPRKQLVNAWIMLGVTLAGLAFLPVLKPRVRWLLPPQKRSVFDGSAPYVIASYLLGAPAGRVFSDWGLGGFLALEQKNPIFMDTRNIIFSSAQFADYRTIIEGGPGWAEALNSYRIRYLVLTEAEDAPLIRVLKNSRIWGLVMHDSGALLYKRL